MSKQTKTTEKTCIVDNWSLCLVADILSRYPIYSERVKRAMSFQMEMEELSDLSKSFGALSNLINAIIFYDKVFFMENGRQNTWQRNSSFASICKKFVYPKKVPNELLLNYQIYSPIQEAGFYMLTAEYLESDLFVSPYRSDEILNSNNSLSMKSITDSLMKEMDERILKITNHQKDLRIKIGIESNLILPSLTQFVLNESSSINTVFDTAYQIRESDFIKKYKNKIIEIIENEDNTQNYLKIKKDIESIFDNTIKKIGLAKRESFEVGFNFWIFQINNFLKISRPIINHNKKHLILLKNIAKCRLEMFNSITTLKRILK